MPAMPRKPPANTEPQTPASQKKRLDKGLWKDGAWWCNCEPRVKAVLRETKKEGDNQGKFFWKCSVYPYCNFFLWRDQAKAREVGLTSPADEDGESARSKAPAFTQRPLTAFGYQVTPGRRLSDVATGAGMDAEATDLTDSDDELALQPAPAAAGMATPCPSSSKRKRDAFEDDCEFSDLNSDEERQMVAIADKSAEKIRASRAPMTPSNTRTHDVVNGLPTPSVARTLFPGPESKRQKQVSFEDTPSSATLTATATPTTTRVQAPPSGSPPDTSYDVTDEVMMLLRGQAVDPDVLTSVRNALTTAARKARGVSLGRDSARASLKARDDRIAALQEGIVALENKERMSHSRMTNIKASSMKMYEDN